MAKHGRFCEVPSHNEAAKSVVSDVVSAGKDVPLVFYLVLLSFFRIFRKEGCFFSK